ncbi:hypothetical protein KBI23_12490 [bacterium]|nr:hypothetical protein [bacterium]
MNTQLLEFYQGTSPDLAGRRIDDVWQFDYSKLEAVHDYIQWLFPSTKASKFNVNAPLLDGETIAVFLADASLRQRLSKSLALMLDFYGLEFATADNTAVEAVRAVRKAANYAERQANWQDAPQGYLNHNLLRVTRILEALTTLGLKSESLALCHCLAEIQQEQPSKIPAQTLHFWKIAAGTI